RNWMRPPADFMWPSPSWRATIARLVEDGAATAQASREPSRSARGCSRPGDGRGSADALAQRAGVEPPELLEARDDLLESQEALADRAGPKNKSAPRPSSVSKRTA